MRLSLIAGAVMASAALLSGASAQDGNDRLTPDDGLEVYISCVANARRTAPGAPAGAVDRYCGCFRRETEQRYTRQSLAAIETRGRANQLTPEDQAGFEAVVQLCQGEAVAPR